MKLKSFCKPFLSLILLGIVNESFATLSGPYFGLQLGWGKLNQGEFIATHLNQMIQKTFPKASTSSMFFSDTGRGGRIFAGYQFNRYFAAEFGYYRFSNLKFNATLNTDITVFEKFGFSIPVDLSSKVEVRTDAFDLVAKGILPLTESFSLYAKLGIAALNSEGKAIITMNTSIADISLYADPSVNIIYPTFGLGMNYDLTQHVSADLSWSRIQKINPCPYPSIDFAAVGLMYHF